MGNKGFSLIQLIVVLVIVGILSMIAIPSFVGYIQSGYARAACHNLNVLANAENSYFLTTGQYCTGSNASTCGDTTGDLNTNLNLNISDSKFSYACSLNASTGFLCTATINSGSIGNISMPSKSFQLVASQGSNTAIEIFGNCVPAVPCSGINNCSTDSCGTSCGTCSATSPCSSNTAGTPGQCTCPNTCPTTGSPCGNDACGNLCGNCQAPPNICDIVPGHTIGVCVAPPNLCAPNSCNIADVNGTECKCPDSTYSCSAGHQCYQCPDLPANTIACTNNINVSSTLYTVVAAPNNCTAGSCNCSPAGVCQAACPIDPSGNNGPGYYNIAGSTGGVGGSECVPNAVCGVTGSGAVGISCNIGLPINEAYNAGLTTWNCQSGSSISSQCTAPSAALLPEVCVPTNPTASC